MFGRDWQEKKDYEEIDDFSPARQAWEFLRRKPAYQLDCKVVLEIRCFLNCLYEPRITKLAPVKDGVNTTGADLAGSMKHDGIKLAQGVEQVIRGLSAEEVNLIEGNAFSWISKRHNLNPAPKCSAVWECMPPMPDDPEPDTLNDLFNTTSARLVYTATGAATSVQLPAHHAAVLVDLTQPITPQIKKVVKKLKELQKNHIGEELTDGKMKKSSNFIRLLDAIAEKEKDNTMGYRDLYEVFDPEAYKQNEGDGLEDKANDYIRKKRIPAEDKMNGGYNHIASKKRKLSQTMHGI